MIDRILVPLDGSHTAECALPHAEAIARRCGAETTLVRIIDQGPSPRSAVDARLREAEANAYLREKCSWLEARGLKARSVVRQGKSADEIIACVRDAGIDLIVLSTHGRGGPGPFRMGGIAEKVVGHAATSVMLIRAPREMTREGEVDYGTVMVPLDGSPQAEWALCLATSLTSAAGADLLLVEAVPIPEVSRNLPRSEREQSLRRRLVRADRRAARLRLLGLKQRLESTGQHVDVRVAVTRNVAETLHRIAESEHVGLVVLSAHGASGASRAGYGGVASHLIAAGTTPLLILQDAPCRDGDTNRTRAARVGMTSNGVGA